MRDDAIAGIDEVDHIEQRLDRIDIDAADHGRFSSVDFGDDHAVDLRPRASIAIGKRAANSANAAVERKFAHKEAVGNLFLVQAAVGADDAQRHGQVKSRTFLVDVGGGEINGDVRGRNVVAAVLQRRAHPVAAFADSGIGQANGVKVVLIALDAGDSRLPPQ